MNIKQLLMGILISSMFFSSSFAEAVTQDKQGEQTQIKVITYEPNKIVSQLTNGWLNIIKELKNIGTGKIITSTNVPLAENVLNIDANFVKLEPELIEYTIDTANSFGVEPKKVLSIMALESGFQKDIISKTNDYGLMQINAVNHNHLSKTLKTANTPLDPKINILWGCYMIKSAEDTAKNMGYIEKLAMDRASLSIYNYGAGGFQRLGFNETYISTYFDKYDKIEIK